MKKTISRLKGAWNSSDFLGVLILFSLPAALGCLAHWVTIEKDLFMFIRVGKEILQRGALPDRELWSSTAFGMPYVHYQWLSSVIMAWVAELGSEGRYLPTARAVVVGTGFFALLAASKARRAHYGVKAAFALIAPAVFIIVHERLFWRPELLTFCLCFIPIVAVWESEIAYGGKARISWLLLVLWSNLHGGTVPFGIVIVSAFLFAEPAPACWNLWRRGALLLAVGATWLMSPIGAKVVAPTIHNSVTADWAMMNNFDHFPLRAEHFSIETHGWSYPLWAILTILGFIAGVARLKRSRSRHDGILFGLAVVFTALAVFRVRARIYPVILLTPLLLAEYGPWFQQRRQEAWMAFAACAVFLIGALGYQAANIMPPLGFGVSSADLPIDSAGYLKTARPAPQAELFNSFDFGGYLGEVAGDRYKVSSDARALPFLGFLKELSEARKSPELFSQFLARHNFNLVVVPPPQLGMSRDGKLTDSHAELYPRAQWALVYLDNASVVYARRIPGNKDLIARDEYKTIFRARPANFGADAPGLSDLERAAFHAELKTCLGRCSRCVYCLMGEASFALKQGERERALELVEKASRELPRNRELGEFAQSLKARDY